MRARGSAGGRILAWATALCGATALAGVLGMWTDVAAGLPRQRARMSVETLAARLDGHVSVAGVDEAGKRILRRYREMSGAEALVVMLANGATGWCHVGAGSARVGRARARGAAVRDGSGQVAGFVWEVRRPWAWVPALGWAALGAGAAYWVLLSAWVFADARRRGGAALALGLFTLLTNVIGLATYMVLTEWRRGGRRECAGCGQMVLDTLRFCPWCGMRSDGVRESAAAGAAIAARALGAPPTRLA